jgi:hypothetical protein
MKTKPLPNTISQKLQSARECLNPDGKRSVNYFYMHDMRHHKIKAYGDSEYGDIHEIAIDSTALVGMYREVCVVTTGQGTWVVRHSASGSLYLEDAIGVTDESKVDVSPIITDRHSVQ